jgi:Domain of unknown function (DUF4157)
MGGFEAKPGATSRTDDAFGSGGGAAHAGKQTLTEMLSPSSHVDIGQHTETSRAAAESDASSRAGDGMAPAAATPEMRTARAMFAQHTRERGAGAGGALQQAVGASGGSPLPEAIRRRMEQQLRADFSEVRVHTDAQADNSGEELNAPAYTVGHNIFFRAGFGPDNEAILAHELTHVVQQGGAKPIAGGAKLGARNDSAEAEADKVASAVTRGDDAPAISTGHDPSTVRRFGAGFHDDGHGSIEKEAAGGSGNSQGLKEMYSGNFMRDMNQLNVPKVIEGLQGLPKDVANPKGEKIGGKGAMELTTAVIKAMAMLELGPKIANGLINKGAIGAYRPEEHIDNPMGTGAADTIVTNTDASRKKDDKKTPVEVGEPRTADGTVPTKMVDKTDTSVEKLRSAVGLGDKVEVLDTDRSNADADRDRDLKGSAFQGNQVENAKLYEVSPGGLGNHIYNSNESVKARWLKAAQLGSSPLGRSEFGAGSHAVEDYFSHSNFVEVALNSYIEQALSFKNKNQTSRNFAEKVKSNNAAKFGTATVGDQHYYVDTLFDPKPDAKTKDRVKAERKRQPITTGSFGGDDTKVSIAHILLPMLPKLQNALLKTVDSAFGIAAAEGDGGWAKIKAMLAGTPEGSAGATLLEGFDSAGMVAPVPDLQLKWKTFPVSPGIFGDPWTVSLPYGIDHIAQSVPITAAFATYAGVYKKAKDFIELVNKYAAYAKKIMIPLDWLIEAINAEVKKIEQMARKAIKEQVTAGLVAVVDSISGRSEKDKAKAKKEGKPLDPKDPDSEFKKDVGDALDYLHDSVEDIEAQTSIESRLKNGDLSQMPKAKVEALVGPVTTVTEEKVDDKGKKVVRTYYKAVNPLPPSHSEVAKDHGPHEEVDHHHDNDDPDHPGNEGGSPFFSLARPLAVEAVKHSDAQMQTVWAQKPGGGDKSLFGDGKMYEFQSTVGGDSKGIHDGVMTGADEYAKQEQQRAKDEGRSYLQVNKEAQIKAMPGTDRLLNLVDFFISHPDDTQWWKPIIDNQIATNPEPIYQSILRRNETRAKRKL